MTAGLASRQAAYDAAEPDNTDAEADEYHCLCRRRDCYDCADYSG
ncbi:hypothetical protein ACIQXM_01840 [Arthrobacter sp. NPDC097144]